VDRRLDIRAVVAGEQRTGLLGGNQRTAEDAKPDERCDVYASAEKLREALDQR
jgi:hypothetical protein